MRNYILRRIVVNIPVIWLVATLVFLATSVLPGDFVAQRIAAQDPTSTDPALRAQQIEAVRHDLGLDKPVPKRYVIYLGNLLKGDFGKSYQTREPALQGMKDGLPYSLQLAIMSLIIGLCTSIPIGIISAIRQDSAIDYILRIFAILVLAMPSFWVGTMLLLYCVKGVSVFGLFTVGWTIDLTDPKLLWEDPGSSFRGFILPAVAGGLASAAGVMRLLRSQMLEVLRQDYIRTARAKGASEARIVLRHALRGGLLPVVAFLGPAVAGILTGSFVIETVFQIPGLGRQFVISAFSRDYTLILGTVILYATLIVACNLIVDIAQVWLNPKLKFE